MTDFSQLIIDTLLERPRGFQIGKRHFYLYPNTIGRAQLVSQLVKKIKLNPNIANVNANIELMRICKAHTKECCRLIAYHCLKGKECLYTSKVEDIMNYLGANADLEDLASLLQLILTPTNIDDIKKHFGIDKEEEELQRVNAIKEDSSSLTFCGTSIYGSLINTLAEKYGWTLDYILWGISYDNVQLLLADAPKTVYLTKEELKKVHTKKNKQVIRVDDPKNKELILSMNWD